MFNTHKKKVKGGHIVTLQLAMALKSNGLDATPGWQLCRSCFGKATAESDESESGGNTSQDEVIVYEEELDKSTYKDKLDESLGIMGISPVKTHSLSKSTKISGALAKIEKCLEKQKEIVANIFDVDTSDFSRDLRPEANHAQLVLR